MLTVILVKVFEEPVRKSILEETTSQSRQLATSTWRSLYGYPISLIEIRGRRNFSMFKIVYHVFFFCKKPTRPDTASGWLLTPLRWKGSFCSYFESFFVSFLSRNIPLSIWMGIPLITICYLLVNIGYITVLTPQEIVNTDAVAVVS